MPSYLVNGAGSEPLEIPGTDGRTVTFKVTASYGDDLAADVAAAQHPVGTPQRLATYVLERTAVMIAAWELVDGDGQPLPISADSLTTLSKEAGNFLAAEARRRFEGRPPENGPPFLEALASALASGHAEDPEVIALLRIRMFAREFGWTPEQTLDVPARLVRDLVAASNLEAQLRR